MSQKRPPPSPNPEVPLCRQDQETTWQKKYLCYVGVFLRLHITAQSGPDVLVILCHLQCPFQWGVNDYLLRKPPTRRDKCVHVCLCMCIHTLVSMVSVLLTNNCMVHGTAETTGGM